jgi:predicted acetyltransferase
MDVEVVGATADQQSILANLLELYSHDFSEISDLQLDSNGRFGYVHLPLYWQESNRCPFLVRVNGTLAGFVFLRKGSEVSGDENVWDVTEFFIVRGHRRHYVGTKAAHEVWRKFPGLWEVRVTDKNRVAQSFWSRAIASFMGITVDASVYKIASKTWHVFSFDTTLRDVSVV